MMIKKLSVKTISNKYTIFIGTNLIERVFQLIKRSNIDFKKCLIVIDTNVPKDMVSKIRKSLKRKNTFFFLIKASEKIKNQNTSNSIINVLLQNNFSRQDCLIAVGGGIIGDISGFAASQFKRGLQFINIPTTLLSQVDSSIGGKTGVNTQYGKNLIGSFYQPKLVVADINFLKTLNKREIICGYGEILKHSLIADKKFFNFLRKNITEILNLKSPFIEKSIFESCKIKRNIVERDENENNLRKVLNFGHTFAHSYEATLGYSKKLNHGEAVILGIFTALKFSYQKNFLKQKDFHEILSHLKNSKLNFNIKNFFSTKNINRILSFMTKDKKNSSDRINLILLKRIGVPIIDKTFDKNHLRSFLKKELIN